MWPVGVCAIAPSTRTNASKTAVQQMRVKSLMPAEGQGMGPGRRTGRKAYFPAFAWGFRGSACGGRLRPPRVTVRPRAIRLPARNPCLSLPVQGCRQRGVDVVRQGEVDLHPPARLVGNGERDLGKSAVDRVGHGEARLFTIGQVLRRELHIYTVPVPGLLL